MTGSTVGVAAGLPPRRGQLALLLQELLTATARLRVTGYDPPADADAFRTQVKQLIATATADGKQLGYRDDDFGFALFAVVAFLDESVLALQLPSFRSWSGRPLSLDLFRAHLGGESFFQYLETLLRRDDSEDLADILEVFLLCLQLGFRGRYGDARPDELYSWTGRVQDRIQRIRGTPPPFAPEWAPPTNERPQRTSDPWQRRLSIVALATTGVAILLFVIFKLVLRSGAHSIVTPS